MNMLLASSLQTVLRSEGSSAAHRQHCVRQSLTSEQKAQFPSTGASWPAVPVIFPTQHMGLHHGLLPDL